jgi:dTDP-4-amino-4,6-dideoxygalactose transaminase
MSGPFKPISISLSPNTEKDDVFLAWKLLFEPERWVNGRATKELEEKFAKDLGVKHAYSFNSGRSSLMAVLNALELENGSEVLLQAFTCNAAANPIIWSGLKPVYVDCNNNYNIDIDDLKKKITSKSKAVMVQHTFGLPADMDEIAELCRDKKLVLIEDCAHSLGAEFKGKKVGTFGKVSFFSFSRDKIISCVYGGMAATNDEKLAGKIRVFQQNSGYPDSMWIEQQLLHPVLMNWIILPTYSAFGKYLLVILQQLRILSKAIHWKEKRGRKPDYFPRRMPNAMAVLALKQYAKLSRFAEQRRSLADFYYRELADTTLSMPPKASSGSKAAYLRFTIRDKDAREFITKAWGKNLLIGDWYTSPVVPDDTRRDKLLYEAGSCPNAEKLARETFNLPTHINISKIDAQRIVMFLKNFR